MFFGQVNSISKMEFNHKFRGESYWIKTVDQNNGSKQWIKIKDQNGGSKQWFKTGPKIKALQS